MASFSPRVYISSPSDLSGFFSKRKSLESFVPSNEFAKGSISEKFANDLRSYMVGRIANPSLFSGADQCEDRMTYINELFVQMKSNKLDEQLTMLDESRIKKFKGFFTQRLYDKLVELRAVLNAVKTGMVVVPTSPSSPSIAQSIKI